MASFNDSVMSHFLETFGRPDWDTNPNSCLFLKCPSFIHLLPFLCFCNPELEIEVWLNCVRENSVWIHKPPPGACLSPANVVFHDLSSLFLVMLRHGSCDVSIIQWRATLWSRLKNCWMKFWKSFIIWSASKSVFPIKLNGTSMYLIWNYNVITR